MRGSLLLSPPSLALPGPSNPSPRLLTVDLIRWLSFYAIVIYHLTFALWARYSLNHIPIRGPLVWPLENYARAFSFSGFTIIFLSFFMFGFNGNKSKKAAWLPLILLGFAVIWLATVEEFPFWWDIYPYLLCALAALFIVQKLKVAPPTLALASGITLSIPFWNLEKLMALPVWAATILLGACQTRNDLGDWPLLPWIAYPLFAYGIGQLAVKNRQALKQLAMPETLVWAAALSTSVIYLGGYFHTPIGEEFGCSVFRRPPIEFWAHQLWIFFIVRLSFLPAVHEWLAKRTVAQWISNSPVNRSFFLIYFIHYPIAFALAWLARERGLDQAPWILAATFILLFLSVECLKLVPIPEAPWLRTNAKSLTT